MIHLDFNIGEKETTIENATLINIQKALTALYLSTHIGNSMVSLTNDSELTLEIYPNTLVLQDYGNFKYDGPGGPGELLRVRIKRGALFPKTEEVMNLLEGYEVEELKKVLKTLPPPDNDIKI